MQIVGFGGFKATWMVSKLRIVHNLAKCVPSDLPLAYPGMTVHMRAKVSLRIVEMEGDDLVGADQGIDFTDGGIPAFGRANVVSCCEEVRCIQTNCQALRLFHGVVNGGQVPDFRAETGPLSSRVLECDADGRFPRGLDYLLQPLHNQFKPGFLACAQMCARMEHEKRE